MNFLLKCEQHYSQFVVLLGGHQHRSAFVLHQEHDEFCRFGFACIPPNDVDVIRTFVEGLTWCQSRVRYSTHNHKQMHARCADESDLKSQEDTPQ
jgi:hypothetical protein